MLTPILVTLAVVVAVFVVLVVRRPSEFSVTRSAVIAAPPEQIFPHVNELRNWEALNPWGKLDTQCEITYEGPPAGVGASYTWARNARVGKGRNTIIESRPNERV